MEILYTKSTSLVIKNSDKKEIVLDTEFAKVKIEDYDVSYPGEYEKGGILLEVLEYRGELFYKFLIDGKHLCIITGTSCDLKEEILGFFGDVDVLVISGSKESVQIYENIEAKMVVPYGSGKDIFLNTLGQHPEVVKSIKVKSDLNGEVTEFVNLEA